MGGAGHGGYSVVAVEANRGVRGHVRVRQKEPVGVTNRQRDRQTDRQTYAI